MAAKPRFDRGYWRLQVMIKGRKHTHNFGKHPGWTEGDPEPKKAPREIQVKADRLLVEWRSLAKMASGEPSRVKLGEFLAEYEATYAASHPPNSVRNLRNAIGHLLAHFDGTMRAASLTPAMCQEFVDARSRAGAAYQTLRANVGYLGGAWSKAVRLETLATNPWKGVRVPGKADVKPPEFWTLDELARLVEACRGSWVHDIVVVAANCGARITSLLTLRWDAVDFDRGVLKLVSKTGAYETPMSVKVREVLESRPGRNEDKASLVFPAAGGKVRHRQAVYRAIKDIALRAGLINKGDFNHILRHTFASHCVMQGVPIDVVAKWLGHSTITMTARYSHLCPVRSREFAGMVNITP